MAIRLNRNEDTGTGKMVQYDEKDIKKIRKLYAYGMTIRAIAERMGVSTNVIGDIVGKRGPYANL